MPDSKYLEEQSNTPDDGGHATIQNEPYHTNNTVTITIIVAKTLTTLTPSTRIASHESHNPTPPRAMQTILHNGTDSQDGQETALLCFDVGFYGCKRKSSKTRCNASVGMMAISSRLKSGRAET